MVLGIAFLLLVSLALSALLAAFGDAISARLPGELSDTMLAGLHFALSFGVVTALFATMFRVLPDARIAWRDVWVGAVGTAALREEEATTRR